MTDRSATNPSACAPPCWQGIVPGETTKDEAFAKLAETWFVHPKYIRFYSEDGDDRYADGSILWRYRGSSDTGGNLTIQDGRVLAVFVPYEQALRFGDILEIQGEPAGFFVGMYGPEDESITYHFLYPERGLALFGVLKRSLWDTGIPDTVTVSPSIRILNATYFVPMSPEEYLICVEGKSDAMAKNRMGLYREWPGLGGEVEFLP